MRFQTFAFVVLAGCAMDVGDPDVSDEVGDDAGDPGDDVGTIAAGATVLGAQADAAVRSSSYANTNYGTTAVLNMDGSDSGTIRQSYIRFDLATVPALTRATLRLYASESSANAFDVKLVSSTTWDETKITWNTRPAVDGPVVASIGKVSSSTWIDIDVTSAVRAGQRVTFALVPRSDDGLYVRSRESSHSKPQLVIENTTCVPTTCAAQGKNCGTISDGCGGTLTCGSCSGSDTCGGGGTANVCGSATTATSCLSGTGPLVTLSGAQSTYDKRDDFGAMTRLDARNASWTGTTLVPVRIGDGDQICWSGGTIRGTWDPYTTSWDAYHDTYAFQVFGNSMTIENLRVDNYGDAVLIRTDAGLGNNFTVRGAYVTNNHDDCVSNDGMKSGRIEDSLFDGCYVFYSSRQVSSQPLAYGGNNVVTLENSLARLQAMPTYYGGSTTDPSQFRHGGFWKIDEFTRTPKLVIKNNIFRADQDSRSWIPLMPDAQSIAESSNNVIVWLGAGEFPEALPPGFTLTRDKAVWDNAVAAWKTRHGVQ